MHVFVASGLRGPGLWGLRAGLQGFGRTGAFGKASTHPPRGPNLKQIVAAAD